MSKAEATKAHIIHQAALLFNQRGYAGSSIADIMQATGLKKGGIYNHFKSKDEIALQAFDYAASLVQKIVWDAVKQKTDAISRLKALMQVHLNYIDNPPLAGGCPIMNTAIESDDAYPILRDRAQQAMESWRNLIIRIVQKGIKKQEIKPDIDAEIVASFLISAIEGAIMMSKLYQDAIHLKRVISSLSDYIESLAYG
ncbi:Transcriptional regulator [Hyella patelloides LEGE 07179]|uniref:Transcriptional regulator n=1 Tax=Hyella patelloides LEGE 07179 TaxID=945734 RepID=A0A563VTJ7_9CYAN|nr:TetR/AcrR family transcriptional regulator [Hyella patelloides]VEP14699.1 Transcriptional regulator [Hyella patelloides LEGE 07179]